MSRLGYCELQVDLGSGMKLARSLLEKLGDKADLIPVNKLHATIMYDVRNPELTASKSDKVYKCKVVGVKALGEPGSKWYSAALVLESPEVQARHQKLKDEEFVHSYDDLLLHVSISYGNATDSVLPALEEMLEDGTLPKTIVLCNETWDTCKD